MTRADYFSQVAPASIRKRKCRFYSILVAGFILCLILMACQDKTASDKAQGRKPEVSGVDVTKIEPSRVDDYYETSGTVRAKLTSTISSRIMGTVMSVNVREGDRVRAGQLLITLDDRDAVQRLKAAEQGLERARLNSSLTDKTYQRYKRLHEERALSGQEIDEIESRKKVAAAEYRQMLASLDEARIYSGFARIVSPSSGWVTEKKIDAGSMAVPGAPLMTVESGSGFDIETYVDESLTGKLKTGMPAQVVIDAVDLNLTGTIFDIVPAMEGRSRTFRIKIAVAHPQLKSGLYARVMIPLGKKEILLVPQKSIMEKGQLTGVYVVGNKSDVTYRLVRAGKPFGNNVEIISGIAAGESIITSGMDKAVDGGVVTNQ